MGWNCQPFGIRSPLTGIPCHHFQDSSKILGETILRNDLGLDLGHGSHWAHDDSCHRPTVGSSKVYYLLGSLISSAMNMNIYELTSNINIHQPLAPVALTSIDVNHQLIHSDSCTVLLCGGSPPIETRGPLRDQLKGSVSAAPRKTRRRFGRSPAQHVGHGRWEMMGTVGPMASWTRG